MKPFLKLLAPVAIAATFPAYAQETNTQNNTAVTQDADAEVATPEKVWTTLDVLNDKAKVEDMIRRLETDPAYVEAVDRMMAKDRENGILADDKISRESYLLLLEATVTNRINADMLAAQSGLAAATPDNDSLQYNTRVVLECRDETELSNRDEASTYWYRRAQQVRGCAINKLKEQPPIIDGIAAATRFPLSADYSLSEKLAAFQSDLDVYDDYGKAVRRERDNMIQHDYIGKMYNRSAIRITHAAFDTSLTFDDFKSIPNENDDAQYEFEWVSHDGSLVDNNMKFFFACRDDLLETNAARLSRPEDRQNHLTAVFDCAKQKAQANNNRQITITEERARMIDIRVDPAPLSDKLARYDRTGVYGTKYADAVELAASLDNNRYMHGQYSSYIRLWDAMLDKNATWDDLNKIQNNSNDPNGFQYEFYWSSNGDPELATNVKLMFECRDQHLPNDLSETDIAARQTVMNSIIDCWEEAMAPIRQNIAEDRAEKRAEEERQWAEFMDDVKDLFKILGGLAGLIGLSVIGKKGYQAHKRRKSLQPSRPNH
tara:strand:- start:302 stop:1939 length:1638 start_codon:yes stop_codon:yes gene_type:complete